MGGEQEFIEGQFSAKLQIDLSWKISSHYYTYLMKSVYFYSKTIKINFKFWPAL